jgi:hypothetical protein
MEISTMRQGKWYRKGMFLSKRFARLLGAIPGGFTGSRKKDGFPNSGLSINPGGILPVK